jgi:arabinofuranan 3-O-arabinosyltransferase
VKRTVARGLRRVWFARSVEWRVLLALSMVLSAVVLANRFGVLTPDTKPEIFLQPGQTARRFAAAWLDTPNLGAANYNTGVAPLAALFAVLEGLGIPAWLIMRLWRIGLLLIAAWGARALVRDLVGRSLGPTSTTVAGAAAAIAYAANPYVVVGGGTTPTLQPYALLPWFVLCLLRGFRTPTWRWAILAALVLAGMGGLNAGIVPALQLVIVIPLVTHALVVERLDGRTVAWLLVRTAMVFLLLSAYWLVPAVAALGVGTSIAEATESVAGINSANSFAEVLRGLGMWTLYGVGAGGPFDPERIAYVTNPLVIVLTFGGPILAGLGVRLSRSPARLFGATSVLVGALVMVGSFPTSDRTVWGRALNSVIENVPGLVALRTTNKAGAVLELGLAVLVGLAAAALAPRLVGFLPRALAVGVAAAVTAASVAPALTGGLFWTTMDLPRYWQEVASDVDARGGDSRVLMVPGVGIPSYTWGYSGPDEIGPSLFERPFVFRSASPSGGHPAAALLGEVDRRLQQGTLPTGTMSTLADYLGVGDVVARHDLEGGAGRRDRVEDQLEDDPGLGPARQFGLDEDADLQAAPVTAREVVDANGAPSVRLRPAQGALIVDGSGAALPALTEAGMLAARPALLLSGALDDAALARAVADGGRLVVTDSNLRRRWSNTNPVGIGPVLAPNQDPGSTRALFTAREQSTSEVRGNAVLTTRGAGLLFGPYPHGTPEAAFDGDSTTSWLFGNYGSGVGNAVVVTPTTPIPMPTITLNAAQGASNAITSVRVTATVGDRAIVHDTELSPWSAFPVQLAVSDDPVSELVVEVTSVSGEGDGAVGFSEIAIPGIVVSKVVTASDSLVRRAPAAAATVDRDLAEVPIDVLLQRGVGEVGGFSTEESRLVREFALPDERTMTVTGTVRLAPSISDTTADRLAGLGGPVVAESSSRVFDQVSARASMALDDGLTGPNLATAWVPGRSVVGEWISVDFPAQRLASFTVSQDDGPALATRALVSVDDGEPFEVDLVAGTTNVVLPEPVEASRVRVLLTERFGSGFVRITDIGLPRMTEIATPSRRCHVVATVDGRPLSIRPTGSTQDLLKGRPVSFEMCGGPLSLGRGSHLVGGVPDFAVDTLLLAGVGADAGVPAAPELEVLHHSTDAMRVRIPDGCSACLLSSGQAHDPRWTASTSGGVSLGAPTVVDGFAAGWQVEVAPGTEIEIRFGPSHSARLAGWLSLAALVASIAVLARVRTARRSAISGRRGDAS